MEDTLNCKVDTTVFRDDKTLYMVEDTLNCKVVKTKDNRLRASVSVEDILNFKVVGTLEMLNPPEGTGGRHPKL